MTFRVGVPKEIKEGENRVALTPHGAGALRKAGAEVIVQAGAGEKSGFPDAEYVSCGAAVVPEPGPAWDVDLVAKVKEPLPGEYPFLSERTSLFTYLHLAAVSSLADALLERKVAAIAYETVASGEELPLLRPMSEVAGILSIQVGARGLEAESGGMGVLLSGVRGTGPARVSVIGAGTAGRSAARTAAGIGAKVAVLDISGGKLEAARKEAGGAVETVLSTEATLGKAVREAALVISTVLIAGDRAPVVISRELLRGMRKGAVVVDLSIDQGGSLETSRPTTHADPFFVEEGIVHYCVTNMPAAVPRTSTMALSDATLPYLVGMARGGVLGALRADESLRAGLNTFRGRITCPGVARALGREFTPPETLLLPG
jgi:alanine dehydrogenase